MRYFVLYCSTILALLAAPSPRPVAAPVERLPDGIRLAVGANAVIAAVPQ